MKRVIYLGHFQQDKFRTFKTRNKMAGAIDDMLDSFDSFEDDLYTELEEILVMSDVGVQTAVEVVEELKKRVASEKDKENRRCQKRAAEHYCRYAVRRRGHGTYNASVGYSCFGRKRRRQNNKHRQNGCHV